MSTVTTPAEAARRELSGFQGRLIGPDDADYDEARKVYNAMIDKRPGADRPLRRARRRRAGRRASPASTICSWPSAAAATTAPGSARATTASSIDLSLLKDVEVDPQARTVRVGGGCTWGEVDAATSEHGLATPSGIISTTGVGGLTLGGGLGHLTRKFGLTIDNLLEAEVVLANGERVRASADEHPDLYWAIRGGGGNFGVVTSFLFRLHEVGTVVARPDVLADRAGRRGPARSTASSCRTRRASSTASSPSISVPPGPPFPEELHLRKVCGVVWCYVGDEEDAAAGDGAAARRAARAAPARRRRRCRTPALQGAFDGVYPPGEQWYWRADFVNEIPDEAVAAHARFGAEMPTWQSTMHLYPIDGAAHDVDSADTAWSYRDAKWGSVFAGVDPDPANVGRDPRLDRRLLRGAAPVLGRRRLREHDDGRGPGAGPRELPRQLRPPRADQGDLRPGQPLPRQPEHPAEG